MPVHSKLLKTFHHSLVSIQRRSFCELSFQVFEPDELRWTRQHQVLTQEVLFLIAFFFLASTYHHLNQAHLSILTPISLTLSLASRHLNAQFRVCSWNRHSWSLKWSDGVRPRNMAVDVQDSRLETMRKAMCKYNYAGKTKNFVETSDIQQLRRRYLQQRYSDRFNGALFVWQDESYCNHQHVNTQTWFYDDTAVPCKSNGR